MILLVTNPTEGNMHGIAEWHITSPKGSGVQIDERYVMLGIILSCCSLDSILSPAAAAEYSNTPVQLDWAHVIPNKGVNIRIWWVALGTGSRSQGGGKIRSQKYTPLLIDCGTMSGHTRRSGEECHWKYLYIHSVTYRLTSIRFFHWLPQSLSLALYILSSSHNLNILWCSPCRQLKEVDDYFA